MTKNELSDDVAKRQRSVQRSIDVIQPTGYRGACAWQRALAMSDLGEG